MCSLATPTYMRCVIQHARLFFDLPVLGLLMAFAAATPATSWPRRTATVTLTQSPLLHSHYHCCLQDGDTVHCERC
jgi:hypothetical protein